MYIEREAIRREVERSKQDNPHTDGAVRRTHNHEHKHFLRMIDDAPVVDAVLVVRCKDCKKSGVTELGRRYCKEPLGMYGCVPVKDNDFCNYGKRRDAEE